MASYCGKIMTLSEPFPKSVKNIYSPPPLTLLIPLWSKIPVWEKGGGGGEGMTGSTVRKKIDLKKMD